MNKKVIWVLMAVFLFAPLIAAQEFPNYQDAYVNDFAKILSVGETGELRAVLQQVREQTTAEVVVVTVDSISPLDVRQYGIELASKWKIGKADKSNGLLILYAVKEKKIGAEVGYGLEGVLNDAKVGRMLDDYYVPNRDSGNVTFGIISFVKETAKYLEQNKDEIISSQKETSRNNNNSNGDLGLIIWIIGFYVIVALIKAIFYPFSKRKNKGAGDFWKYVLLGMLLSPRRSSGFSGGGFSGGGGFGGGGFGGGGASR
ncbi:MAG: TPM domain-containing protein [Nanoarchaeota archaeon]